MKLRSGIGYDDFGFDSNKMIKMCCGSFANACELEILFINQFCLYIKQIQKIKSQQDKLTCMLKIYELLYNSRDVFLGLYVSNEDFLQFIRIMFDKSKTMTSFIFDLIPDYKGDANELLMTLYYLDGYRNYSYHTFGLKPLKN